MRVQQQIERPTQRRYQALESDVAQKRVAWFKRNSAEVSSGRPPSPRRAYELLLLEYLGLREEEVPVVSETQREIECLSVNACPTLEACRRLDAVLSCLLLVSPVRCVLPWQFGQNVTSIVYGASIEETARFGKSRIRVGAREIAQPSPALVEIVGDVPKDECLALYA